MIDTDLDYQGLAEQLLRQQGLPTDRAQVLVDVLKGAELQTFDNGDLLLAEGEPAHTVMVLVTGKIRVLLDGMNGRASVVANLSAPLLFGHFAVIDGGRRSARCEMGSAGQALCFPREVFDQILAGTRECDELMRMLLLESMLSYLDESNAKLQAFLRSQRFESN